MGQGCSVPSRGAQEVGADQHPIGKMFFDFIMDFDKVDSKAKTRIGWLVCVVWWDRNIRTCYYR